MNMKNVITVKSAVQLSEKQPWVDGGYKVNESKRTITYCLRSRGKNYFGVAKCMESDEFDVNYGLQIAKMRALIQARAVTRLDWMRIYSSTAIAYMSNGRLKPAKKILDDIRVKTVNADKLYRNAVNKLKNFIYHIEPEIVL